MPPIDDAKLAELMAKHYPDLVCKYYPDHPSYTPPPSSKPSTPPTIETSLAKLGDSIAKLELITKRLAASIANLVSITSQTTFTTNESNTRLETTLQKLICQPTVTRKESNDSTSNTDIIDTTTEVLTDTSSLTTDNNKPNSMAHLITDFSSSIAKIETKVVRHIPLSPLSGLHANPTHKKLELPHDIDILHRTTLNETYGRAPLIASMLAIFCCAETFPPVHQLHPPQFVFIESEQEPPWEPRERRYITTHEPGSAKRDTQRGIFIVNGDNLSLEDKAAFQDGSIDTCMMS